MVPNNTGYVACASTFNYPIRYKQIPNGIQERVLNNDRTLITDILQAAKELEMEGVRSICVACGYLGYFQNL